MTSVEDFLNNNGIQLAHAKNKNFDESKVKRDGVGRFSKKTIDSKLDALWAEMLERNKDEIVDASLAEMLAITARIAKKHGIELDEVEKKAFEESSQAILKVLNDRAKKMGVSPSGSQIISFGLDSNKKLAVKAVPYSGPNPHSKVTSLLRKETVETLAKVEKKSGSGMSFNPRASLDPSQIQKRKSGSGGGSGSGGYHLIQDDINDASALSHDDEDSRKNSLVIVAIPERDDPVWRLSSEKVPHLTLLYLGEHDVLPDTSNIQEFLEHVASQLSTFYLMVDHRGTLGDKNADVLFFDKTLIDRVKDARGYLLKNDEIRKLYDSTPQFDGWTPHLTLGYPDKPASPDNRDNPGTHGVHFDRLALWTDESEGPEFRLKSHEGMEVAMSDNKVDAFLAHYGVKTANASLSDPLDQHIADMLAKYGKEIFGSLTDYAKRIPEKEQLTTMRSIVADMEHLNELLGTSEAITHIELGRPSVKLTWDESKVTRNDVGRFASKAGSTAVDSAKDFFSWATKQELKLRDKTSPLVERITRVAEKLGWTYESPPVPIPRRSVDKIRHSEQEVAMSDNKVDNFLAHYGVLGMRWGVRRSDFELKVAKAKRKLGIGRSKGSDGDTDKKAEGSSSGGGSGSGGASGTEKEATRLSADAERFIKTTQKASPEMSDREMREAISRAKMIKEYNDIFNQNKSYESLKREVETLRLRKDLAQMRAELNPSRMTKVKSFLKGAESNYKTYSSLDKATGGALSDSVRGTFRRVTGSTKTQGKHTLGIPVESALPKSAFGGMDFNKLMEEFDKAGKR